MKKLVSIISMTIALGACSGQTSTSEAPQAQVSGRALGSDEILSRIYELAPKKLNPQECGLFLWLKRSDTPLVYFQRASRSDLDAHAEMVIDGMPKQLTRTSRSNLIALSYYEQQQFTVGDVTLELKMKADRSQSLRQGMKIPAATISLKDSKGWSAVLPVAGAIACQ
ncbi:hypothetical protein KFE96_15995 [Kordiimonas sp. SCSIO 12603]|uniref:hypothetical protein n=1 Tax=Kordiimonas sp. SCSIO 12603 TaxID=2829596 RepID=UPI002103CDA5|nr:hypothetical protein [Kordiimonas sp. SCSIO 12603]UTW58307.1 hypothetical protein KFE96_15995 [Kordiimonas sp. SCSIO 12603]